MTPREIATFYVWAYKVIYSKKPKLKLKKLSKNSDFIQNLLSRF